MKTVIVSLMLAAVAFGQAEPARYPMVPDINAMAVSLVKPAFPETAVAVGADGEGVNLRVVVDENGNVILAKCSVNCHPMLREAAELAASLSKFRPLTKDGVATKYEGSLHYSFVIERVDWARFGTFLESARQFDNISVGPASQILSGAFADEKKRLAALDEKGTTLETRWRVMREVENSLKSKLKGRDLWRFETSMALRRITFWTMAGEMTDRPALQKAIDEIPRHIAAAPEGVSAELLRQLGEVAKYRVPAELPERDLRQAIRTMAGSIRID